MDTPSWSTLSEEDLLQMRICDLDLTIGGTGLESGIQQLYEELSSKGISFHPECYLGDEWFTPEGVPTIALPFFLTHPRLKDLEQKMMLEVEGGSRQEFMRLLRHEAGHALSHAYRLNRTPLFREVFGSPAKNYKPEIYRPRHYSKSYVQHLDNWYAQAHPEEDFAETFAVWLTPASNWKEVYRGWAALKKLQYVDRTMQRLGNLPPKNPLREKPFATAKIRSKLTTYYRAKRKLYAEDYPDFYDTDLRRLFPGPSDDTSFELASRFMRRNRKALVASIAGWTAEKKYTINMLVKRLAERCMQLKLRVDRDEISIMVDTAVFLSTLINNYRLTGSFKKRP